MSQIDLRRNTAPRNGPLLPLSIDLLPSASVLWKLWALLVALLAVGMYLAPELTAVALVMLGIVLPLMAVIWRRPEIGVIGLVALTSSFVRPNIIDVRLPIGGLDLRDLVLLGMIGMLGLQQLLRGDLKLPWPVVSIPLIAFLLWSVVSAATSIVVRGLQPSWAMNELRPLIYFASFFVAAWGLRTQRQLKTVLIGLFVLADITTLLIIMQQFLGIDNPILVAIGGGDWRVWRMGSGNTFGTVRVIPPGHTLMYIMSIVAFSLTVAERQTWRQRTVYALQFVFLNIGLVLTYTRSQWVASAIALALVALFLPMSDKTRIMRYGLQAFVALLIGYTLFSVEIQSAITNMPFIESFTRRLESLFTPEETLETYSLEWRVYETEEAFRSIGEHPFVGVGLGNYYRNVTLLQGEASGELFGSDSYGRFTRYLHNSYLFVAVKLGLIGLALIGWFGITFVIDGWRTYLHTRDPENKRLIIAVLASFVGFLAWSITHSNFFYTESTSVIAFMIGVVAFIRRINRQSTTATQQGRA